MERMELQISACICLKIICKGYLAKKTAEEKAIVKGVL